MKRLIVSLVLSVTTASLLTCCATSTQQPVVHWPTSPASQSSELVYRFKVTTWQETTLQGIPFFVHCQQPDGDQGFLLGSPQLSVVACGYLDPDGIVWTNWILENPKTKPGQTLTLELWTIGPDKVGITEVSLLGDGMFNWDGSDPKNPPEEG